MRLYLDVETYRPRKEDAFVNEVVIAIGIVEDSTPYSPESAKAWSEPSIAFKYFTIGKVDGESISEKEKKLIGEFYEYFMKLVDAYKAGRIDFLSVVGFNILRYDIPLLIQKGVEYGVASPRELNALWHSVFTIDYFQTSLPFHGMRFKGLKLGSLVEWAKKAGIEIPEPYGSGEDIARWFENNQYNDVIKHLEKDLEIIRIIDLNSMKIYEVIYTDTSP